MCTVNGDYYIVPRDLLRYARSIGCIGLSIMNCLYSHRNTKTGACYPSISTIAAETGASVRSVIKYLKILEEGNLIFIYRESNTVNNYEIIDSQTWITKEELNQIRLRYNRQQSSRILSGAGHAQPENTEKLGPQVQGVQLGSELDAPVIVQDIHPNNNKGIIITNNNVHDKEKNISTTKSNSVDIEQSWEDKKKFWEEYRKKSGALLREK